MKVEQVVSALEHLAPRSLACDWDNTGLLLGDGDASVRKLLLCIDMTPAVVDEAVRGGFGMVMAYHPVIFKSIARLTADTCPAAYRAARAGLSVYSVHTALDGLPGGIDDQLADILGIGSRRPLHPTVRSGQCKIVTFVPATDLSAVADAAFGAGAGRIGNYFDCAFFSHGIGSFRGDKNTHPTIGAPGKHEATEEMRLEIVAPVSKAAEVCAAIRRAHSYEEPVIDVYPLQDLPAGCGLGRIGQLAKPLAVPRLLAKIKRALGLKRLLVAAPGGASSAKALAKLPAVQTAACGAGAGGELLLAAIAGGATFFLTGELSHHKALHAAQSGMTVICAGHSNTERLALERLVCQLNSLLPDLTVAVSKTDRDPFEVV